MQLPFGVKPSGYLRFILMKSVGVEGRQQKRCRRRIAQKMSRLFLVPQRIDYQCLHKASLKNFPVCKMRHSKITLPGGRKAMCESGRKIEISQRGIK
jgi:hypothetical protein